MFAHFLKKTFKEKVNSLSLPPIHLKVTSIFCWFRILLNLSINAPKYIDTNMILVK